MVTGVANQNSIGFATARALAADGASLAIVDVSELVEESAQVLRRQGFDVDAFVADLQDFSVVRQLADRINASRGHVDILVNNAGLTIAGTVRAPYERLVDMAEEKWDQGISINLKTQFNCCKAVIPGMLDRGYGRVVNVSSTTGPLLACKGQPEYCAAKAGVLGLTRGLALEVAAQGVLVNAIAPGWVDTGGSSKRGLAAGRAVPLGRAADPSEIAEVVAFLASEKNSYLTGQLIVVDGGNSLVEYHGPPELDV